MKDLLESAREMLTKNVALPFAVYSSFKKQTLSNVPIAKPVLICVLEGTKFIGADNDVQCDSGSFVLLPNSPSIHLRNIPRGAEYFALLIEFELSDFECLPSLDGPTSGILQADINEALQQCLIQFVNCANFIPKPLWASRRQEILLLLQHQHNHNLRNMASHQELSHQVHRLISADLNAEISSQLLADKLALSESTLRRKLRAEGTSVQDIKDRVKLGVALHMIQTSFTPIGVIAERCGYQSQSRFTDKFKQRFGLTPTALRKTRMLD